ncbi:amino acid deaminase/aldolase [Amycolatopsis taiwanensis]|uniref:Alanine racemase n=1 Tax=Amycolatopsis taiwanensis TaxID=342230 RepID=A0A9W6QUU2_9PSEU|nr:amino acid deaminase/aldolase [Amycolatopsis taiwanensis]GLY64143.1 alanine racemase [Amycolatopsis taiwanensis]
MTTSNAYDLATKDLDPPLAVIDLAAFDANAEDLLRRAAGRPIRVASKSVRCRHLLERVLALPGFRGLMCYSLPEALWHAELGTSDDILVAYPSVDYGALRALAADERARESITIMIDSTDHLDAVDAAAGHDHPEIRVCLEVDASWRPMRALHVGTRRSPVFTARQAADLTRKVMARKGFRLVGLMAYEGQIAGVPDRTGRFTDRAVRWMQQRSAAELAQRRAEAVRRVRAIADLEFVNGGGSGSVEITRAESAVTEIAAGSALIGSTLFDGYTRFRPQPAAFFALPVVHKPTRDIATLFAGGYLASGPPSASRLPSPCLPAGLRLVNLEGAGEVQTPVTGKPARDLRIGDRVWFRHAKAGELAERFDDYHIVVDNRVERTVPTYRGEARNFG